MYCEVCNLTGKNTRIDGPCQVVNTATGETTESHPCAHLAERASYALNLHETDNGRPAIYATKGTP